MQMKSLSPSALDQMHVIKTGRGNKEKKGPINKDWLNSYWYIKYRTHYISALAISTTFQVAGLHTNPGAQK